MKMYLLLHTFLTSALDGGEWLVSMPPPLYPQDKSPQYPLDRRLGGPQSQSAYGVEKKSPVIASAEN
jgi:hypothetical protein